MGGLLSLLVAGIFLAFSLSVILNMLARDKYTLSVQSKSLIIELTTLQTVNGRYFCDGTVYGSLAEAERNPKCLKITLL
jgi:hypothetical protein